ncbi:S-adenosylmethionine-dependent methyltransferase [Saxophila tyrrhenica]|uniref:tRNA(Phe) (4-demethylwyosine(37)-C(7)) aminocarboxypropyltransferase n=1 Tax=Saxophila tyrrhenica TaxID=1690608 RepID=A0AAV9P065_9PEZI|nr:S-adenosylmethionine-dependent methyltransferase [Saxophila tyrrhenica]
MLLLSHNAFQTPTWQELKTRCSDENFQQLYELLAKHLRISHIAINKPIPPQSDDIDSENILRAPQNFTPLYGEFGPTTCSSPPTKEDFDAAFWVTAKQNDIYQTWAPRWTMFSRGNISEKARLLGLSSVHAAIEQGQHDGRGCAAVDLYAGIGYFAFSYLKAGVNQVLCWDINAWSIEGLRKGAKANKWDYATYGDHDAGFFDDGTNGEVKLLIFEESNENAPDRVRKMQASLPPIRHVNCGLLPSSQHSWRIAANVLDRELGGWIHVHGNFGISEIGDKAEGIRESLEHMSQSYGQHAAPQLEGIHQVKSYAPGVMHCVLDIYIPPADLH